MGNNLTVTLQEYKVGEEPHSKWRIYDSETGEIFFDGMYNFNIAYDKCLENDFRPVDVVTGIVY